MSDPDFIRSLFTADCMLIVERNATVTWCNGSAADLIALERGSTAHPGLAADCGIFWSDNGDPPVDISSLPLDLVWAGESLNAVEVCVNNERTFGHPIWYSVSVAPVFEAAGNSVSAAMVVAHDITGRRKALRGLEDSNATLTALLQASPLPILAFGLDGNITYWNRAAESVFGWKSNEVIGKPVPFIPAEKVAEHRQMRIQDMSGGMLVNREIRRRRKDGEPIDLSVSTAPVRDKHGSLTGTICVYMDISERKKLEGQLWQSSRMESLGILAGGVAHDFNNLLTSILGNASLAIHDAPEDSDQELALRNVMDACERAVVLTNQMLAYSGKGRFSVQCVDISTLMREMRPLIESTLGAGISARFDLRENLPLVQCDPHQLQQVVMNVVINAGEAIAACGEVTVRTSLATPHVCIEISDTGCGMDADTRARMFDPFFSTKFTGRGLGLAAVIGIVRGHNGIVEVTSAVGEGTNFRVLLPAAEINQTF